jgi:hypothetical protein
MEKRSHVCSAARPAYRGAWCGLAAVLAGMLGLQPPSLAAAASLSPQELQVLGGALAFLQPPPGSGSVAVVYAPGDAASRQDADAIAAAIGGGLRVGSAILPAQVVEPGTLAAGGFALAIAAAGANSAQLGATVRARHLLCVTAAAAAVQAGFCTMAISTELRVQILLNHAAAAEANIVFAPAFRMMIREM